MVDSYSENHHFIIYLFADNDLQLFAEIKYMCKRH